MSHIKPFPLDGFCVPSSSLLARQVFPSSRDWTNLFPALSFLLMTSEVPCMLARTTLQPVIGLRGATCSPHTNYGAWSRFTELSHLGVVYMRCCRHELDLFLDGYTGHASTGRSDPGPHIRLVLNGATFPLSICEKSEQDKKYGTCSIQEFVRANNYSKKVECHSKTWNAACKFVH